MIYELTKSKSRLLIPLLGMLLVTCQRRPDNKSGDTPAPNAAAAQLPVDIITAQEEELQQHETAVGSLMPYQEVSIVSEIAQRITYVAFKDGAYVDRGATLYTLNDTEIRARLKQVGAELELAQINKDRLHNLLNNETVNQQEYDEALMRFRSLAAQQDLLRAELAKTVIKAPFSGRIGISKVHTGAYVIPGTALVDLQDQTNLKLDFSIPERYFQLINKGTKVHFTTELSDQPLEAKVVATEPGLNTEGRSLQAQALVSNVNGKLRPGLSAKIYFGTSDHGAKGIKVPTEALMPDGNGYHAFIIKNGKAKPVPVNITNRTETEAIVTSGLTSGDSVIISNLLRLAADTPVKAVTQTNQ
ncbi:efflux RND transporter periplasmic adaptor subunit [Sphingobacterium thalpophilum]|uniref:efflux RND transporter periplasmic adaptor subunit n=1 Tax=Sphingobacterium TaxID=28453 RepID=UPI002242DC19|nr:efflux RND transporter periplasmic adaptor subunit [Sphingobacterium sp. InxBP1]MCW8311849.1 efflux RND transporter periplasmic adaptor subunit [Sphingobacterium sp. InxBP1]